MDSRRLLDFVISVLLIAAVGLLDVQCTIDVSRTEKSSAYAKLLQLKHAEQLRGAKSIASLGDYAKQYQMVSIIYEKMFQVLSEAKLVIESSGYVHGDDLPSNTTVRDAVSTTVENSLFFGNVLLRLPDIGHKVLARNRQWRFTLQWSWQLCNELDFLLDKNMRTVLDLAGQELGFIDRSEDYVNPYAKSATTTTTTNRASDAQQQQQQTGNGGRSGRRKREKTMNKGPRLSTTSRDEL